MDKVTLLKSGQVFMSRFAAPSVSSGRFVAAIVDSDADTVREAFEVPQDILVQNVEELYADRIYSVYSGIHELRESNDEVTVILDKGESV